MWSLAHMFPKPTDVMGPYFGTVEGLLSRHKWAQELVEGLTNEYVMCLLLSTIFGCIRDGSFSGCYGKLAVGHRCWIPRWYLRWSPIGIPRHCTIRCGCGSCSGEKGQRSWKGLADAAADLTGIMVRKKTPTWGFHKLGYPTIDGLHWKIPLQWMIPEVLMF